MAVIVVTLVECHESAKTVGIPYYSRLPRQTSLNIKVEIRRWMEIGHPGRLKSGLASGGSLYQTPLISQERLPWFLLLSRACGAPPPYLL
jgi:hypothetical protein